MDYLCAWFICSLIYFAMFEFPTPAHLEASIAIGMTTIGYMCFWSVVSSEKPVGWMERWYQGETAREMKIYLQRATGVLMYGIIPACIYVWLGHSGPADFGLSIKWEFIDTQWAFILCALALIIARLSSPKPKSHLIYPEVRTRAWGRSTLLRSAFWWASYFLAYETMFRGFLLFSCVEAFGTGPALVINLALYALTHVAKTMDEAIGAVIMGTILCIVTLQTGTIWVAFLVHTTLSLSNEWWSLRFHPEIGLKG